MVADCKDAQAKIMQQWSVFTFFLMAFVQPALLSMAYDFEYEVLKTLPIMLAPVTVAWVFLLIALIALWYKVRKYYKKVTRICNS